MTLFIAGFFTGILITTWIAWTLWGTLSNEY